MFGSGHLFGPSRLTCGRIPSDAESDVLGGLLRGLGELESTVMDVLWDAPEAMTVRDVREALAERRDWAYTTVLTVMDNLHSKGWLTRTMNGRAYLYRPVAGRETYVAELMGEALHDSEDRPAALMHFVTAMTPEDAAALRAALRRVGRRDRRAT